MWSWSNPTRQEAAPLAASAALIRVSARLNDRDTETLGCAGAFGEKEQAFRTQVLSVVRARVARCLTAADGLTREEGRAQVERPSTVVWMRAPQQFSTTPPEAIIFKFPMSSILNWEKAALVILTMIGHAAPVGGRRRTPPWACVGSLI
jgi:hypothetical protein